MAKKFLDTETLKKYSSLPNQALDQPASCLPEFDKYDHEVKHVVIASPAYGAGVTFATFRSIMQDIPMLANQGVVCEIDADCGGAEIDTARAKIFSKFLQNEKATDLVFVDTDVGWFPGGLVKLLANPVHFVGGAYPQRRYPIQYPVNISADQCVLYNGLMSVMSVPGGFMRITKECAQSMAENYRHMRCIVARAEGEQTYDVYCLFDHYWIDQGENDDGSKRAFRRLSEDISFCRRWADIGGQVWLDPFIEMQHVGEHSFQGCLGKAFLEDAEPDVKDPRDPAVIKAHEDGEALSQ